MTQCPQSPRDSSECARAPVRILFSKHLRACLVVVWLCGGENGGIVGASVDRPPLYLVRGVRKLERHDEEEIEKRVPGAGVERRVVGDDNGVKVPG